VSCVHSLEDDDSGSDDSGSEGDRDEHSGDESDDEEVGAMGAHVADEGAVPIFCPPPLKIVYFLSNSRTATGGGHAHTAPDRSPRAI
jgi:hypothetical protein